LISKGFVLYSDIGFKKSTEKFDDFIYRSFDTYINKVMSSIILTNMLLGSIGLILINKEK